MGAGSLGPVFRAHDPIEGRLVALKMFRLDLPPEQTADLAAALEDVVSQQPHHPTLAAALAAGVEGKQSYLAQEYIVGDSLDAVIRQSGRPSIDATLVTLSRLAEALDRAAGEGIHHGALHLRDVLMEDGAPRLIDVGVAQALQKAGVRAQVRLPYSAPERVEDRPWGGPADIFALGAIAFELVTGRRIVGPGAPSVWAETVPGADVNALSDVFSRALAIEPGARFGSASDLVDALRPILARTQTAPSTIALPAELGASVPDETELAAVESAPESDESHDTTQDDGPLPSFLAPADAHHYGAREERDDDISADLPLIASAGAAPLFEVAADDRPGLFAPREETRPLDEPARSFLDVGTPSPSQPAEPGAESRASQSVTEPTLTGPMWAPPADSVRERRPFLALIIALVVGVAGGFGWGYWTAWRTAERGTAAAASRVEPAPPSTVAPQAPPTQRVEEPPVLGESKLPPPSPAPRRPASPPPAPSARTAVPAAASAKRAAPEREKPPAAQNESRRTPSESRRVAAAAAPVTQRARKEEPRTPAATTGSLLVDSRPAGAEVTIDGRAVGVTPTTIDDLSPGEHRVVLQIPGFNLWATTAQVKAGSRTRVAASLEQVQ